LIAFLKVHGTSKSPYPTVLTFSVGSLSLPAKQGGEIEEVLAPRKVISHV
jgi:hypothetical protein